MPNNFPLSTYIEREREERDLPTVFVKVKTKKK